VYDGVLYLSLVVFIQYQNRKIGSDALKCVIEGKTGLDFKEIQVSVDEKNTASMRLFQNAGFIKIGQKDGLVDLQYIM
jgi:L-amino acid N-acyltransferase YncA